MSQTIWKIALKHTAVQEITIPADAEILTAREQGIDICIWFRCDPTNPAKRRSVIAICGTGHAAPSADESKYLGTVILGALVFHVFERISPTGKEDAV